MTPPPAEEGPQVHRLPAENPDTLLDRILGYAANRAGDRLADDVLALHELLRAGVPFPTGWAQDRTEPPRPAETRPLPGDREQADAEAAAIMLTAGATAAKARKEHIPRASRRSRVRPGEEPPLFCAQCGHAWPCPAALLGAAYRVAAPWWRWAQNNRAALDRALLDAAAYRGGRAGDCAADGNPCAPCADDADSAGWYRHLLGLLRRIP
jgi:hypothetical protein